jgi:hypothetical protein
MPDSDFVANDNPKCPLCLAGAEVYLRKDPKNFEGRCPCCGQISVTHSVVESLHRSKKIHLLSALFRRRTEKGQPIPNISDDNIEEFLGEVEVPQTISMRLDLLLRVLAERTGGIGVPIKFQFDRDYPLVAAENWEEAKFLLDQLQHRGLVDFEKFTGVWRVSADGFERLEEISRANPTNSDRAFVAMWFDSSQFNI